MSAALIAAIAVALAFAFTNGIHDAADAIATLVVTRAATPVAAVTLAAVGNVAGPLLLGSAVADTVAGVVIVPADQMVFVLGAALTGAVVWNLVTWWKGLPSSSSHALLGGLVGAALAQGGTGAVNWGGFDGIKPVGVFGILGVLAIAPVAGFAAGVVVNRIARRAAARATRRVRGPVRGGQWLMSGGLAFTPRRQRRPEVGRHRGPAPVRRRRDQPVRTAHLGGVGLRSSPSPSAPRSVDGRSSARSVGASSACAPSTRSPARPRRPVCSSPRR